MEIVLAPFLKPAKGDLTSKDPKALEAALAQPIKALVMAKVLLNT